MTHNLAVILTLAVPAALAEHHAPAAASAPARVRVVTTAPAQGTRWVAGSLAAVRRAVVSTRTAASVRSVEVEEGAHVHQGALLVRLSDDDVRAQLAAAETALVTAAAQARRIEALAAQRSATPVELDQARAQRAQAEAAVSAARAALAYTEIRAPFAGTVQARRVNAGDLVGPGQPLLELEGSELEVVASLSDAEASGIAIGQTIRFEAGGEAGAAQVSALAVGGDPLSHRRTLRARVHQGGATLRSGTFARLVLPAGAEAPARAVSVPRSALVERGDLTGVFVAAGGLAQLRWLALGDGVGDRVPVRAGLAAGEAVIDAPGALRDGQRIEVAP
ncbi:efflux RND transporter periplasmic adaptor subunit [Anaeromyxobacter oryzae]|uniref:MexH family multidrug efflux RND transporter periplasmic adaptor subunit n=1 Tax=Anaeromyxobacter oryzae TaxID=2918170 RepID=A0ABM7WTR3_9BACT|nr:efflux RND transporter periplasmic adaptor subunit [Anaeromyxobacter oryzae]BDG02882.1 MexH family multidrug efflux RND transporter periplasmic adaptor subunit [Anaeromyxobacter oryzae]